MIGNNLETFRELLIYQKEIIDEENLSQEALTIEEAPQDDSSQFSSTASEAEVPQEITLFAGRCGQFTQEYVLADSRMVDFKCAYPSEIAENRSEEIPIQRNFKQPMKLDATLLTHICGYLDSRDLLTVRNANRLCRRVALTVLLQRSLHHQTFEAVQWELLIDYQFVNDNRPDTFRMHSQHFTEEESEHSRDLDRTFLTEETEQAEGQIRLDRVLRALSSNMEYFQGLNYITAAFLARYPEDFSYWCVRYLMRRVEYFPTKLTLLRSHLENLESIVERQLPTITKHLRDNDVELEYFAMRWLLTLYSYDTEVDLMLKLWRLTCLTDTGMILSFTLVLLRSIEHNILEREEESLNDLLKFHLKELADRLDRQQLLRETVQLYLEQFLEAPSQLESINFEMEEEIWHHSTVASPVADPSC